MKQEQYQKVVKAVETSIERQLQKEELIKMKGILTGQSFCNYLEQMGIEYTCCVKHPIPVDCEASSTYYQRYKENIGQDYSICKHLFLREQKGEKRYFLVIVDHKTSVDLKQLQLQLGTKKLGFAREEEMQELLHTTPGNVSIFNIQFDVENKVHLYIDKSVCTKTLLAFHPLYNGMSIFLSPKDTFRFLDTIQKSAEIISVPTRVIEQEQQVQKILKIAM